MNNPTTDLIPIIENPEGKPTVNARDLHAFLEVGRDFSNWIKDRIEKYEFEENVDFETICEASSSPQGGRPYRQYLVSIDTAKKICWNESCPNAAEAYAQLLKHENVEVAVHVLEREEYYFGKEIVYNLFSEYKIYPQYPVFDGKFRIDWYIPELNLAVEFDEFHHMQHTQKDESRQFEIEKELGCKFIRYNA